MTTALDTNILVHLLVSTAQEHARCVRWLNSHSGPWVTTHTNVAEFIRLVTHRKVFTKPLNLHEAVNLLSGFLADFNVSVLPDFEEWWQQLSEIKFPFSGNDVFDARIALCLRHHGVSAICSLDDDFSRFDFLQRLSPP